MLWITLSVTLTSMEEETKIEGEATQGSSVETPVQAEPAPEVAPEGAATPTGEDTPAE